MAPLTKVVYSEDGTLDNFLTGGSRTGIMVRLFSNFHERDVYRGSWQHAL